MLLTRRSLPLLPSPPSVKTARTWVREALESIGRHDLVESAQLAVSELVTNALIHAVPPYFIRVLGTVAHPRIEVLDTSPIPPRRAPVAPQVEDVDDFNLITFGRGLDLVAMMSRRWGSDLGHDGKHKTVWFEPVAELREDENALHGEIFGFTPESPHNHGVADADRMLLVLLNVPTRLFRELRRYHFEVRRELRLLSLTAPSDYPLAVRFTDIFVQADKERRSSTGIAALDGAIALGVPTVDLTYEVPLSTPVTMTLLRDILEEVFATYGEEFLLAMRPPEVLHDLQTWYFGEFERQGRGEPPRPWTGPLTMAFPSAG
ncbi:MAG: ATP-binding protein [Marmoricola sp.]